MEFSLDDKIFTLVFIPIFITIVGNLMFYILARSRRVSFYCTKNNTLSLQPFSSGSLSIQHAKSKSKIIGPLAKEKVIFVNSNKQPIKKEDLFEKFKVSVDGKLISFKILSCSNETIKVHLTQGGLIVDFEYLKRGEGLVLELVIDQYAGVSIDDPFIDIKLVKKPLDMWNFIIRDNWFKIIGPKTKVVMLRVLLTFFVLIILLASMFMWEFMKTDETLMSSARLLQCFIVLPMYFYFMAKFYSMPLINKELHVFFNE